MYFTSGRVFRYGDTGSFRATSGAGLPGRKPNTIHKLTAARTAAKSAICRFGDLQNASSDAIACSNTAVLFTRPVGRDKARCTA
jgi:hypothetical protein